MTEKMTDDEWIYIRQGIKTRKCTHLDKLVVIIPKMVDDLDRLKAENAELKEILKVAGEGGQKFRDFYHQLVAEKEKTIKEYKETADWRASECARIYNVCTKQQDRIKDLSKPCAFHAEIEQCPLQAWMDKVKDLEAEIKKKDETIDILSASSTIISPMRYKKDAPTAPKKAPVTASKKPEWVFGSVRCLDCYFTHCQYQGQKKNHWRREGDCFKPKEADKKGDDEWKEPQCPECGGPMVHVGHDIHGRTTNCAHWFCEKCKMDNWPAGFEMGDECPVCYPKEADKKPRFEVPDDDGGDVDG
jgi:hypothetical protein